MLATVCIVASTSLVTVLEHSFTCWFPFPSANQKQRHVPSAWPPYSHAKIQTLRVDYVLIIQIADD